MENKIKYVVSKLLSEGFVDNYSMIDNRITTRLSAVILYIKDKYHMSFCSTMLDNVANNGRRSKNCFYIVENWGTLRPTRTAKKTAKIMLKNVKTNKLHNFQK